MLKLAYSTISWQTVTSEAISKNHMLLAEGGGEALSAVGSIVAAKVQSSSSLLRFSLTTGLS